VAEGDEVDRVGAVAVETVAVVAVAVLVAE